MSVSFLAYLKHCRETSPALSLSSSRNLQNWALEFKQWSPDFKVVSLAEGWDEPAEISLYPKTSRSCVTTYEMCLIEKSVLNKISFEYILIGPPDLPKTHRVKNVDSILSQSVRTFTSRGRLLITGIPPLQNALKEIFSLLNLDFRTTKTWMASYAKNPLAQWRSSFQNFGRGARRSCKEGHEKLSGKERIVCSGVTVCLPLYLLGTSNWWSRKLSH